MDVTKSDKKESQETKPSQSSSANEGVSQPSMSEPASNGKPKSFFLRPSPLQHHANLIKINNTDDNSTNNNTFKLEPPKLICPLNQKKVLTLEDNSQEATSTTNNNTTESSTSTNNTTSTNNSSVTRGFIFGSNLSDRVVNGKNEVEEEEEAKSFDAPVVTSTSNNANNNLSLEQSAQEQFNKDNKTHLKEVKCETGEEGESNVLQVMAKLHVFDKRTQGWSEKGRGLLRLNDLPNQQPFQSRLVMRAKGSLRLLLNIKLWKDMLVQKVNNKNIKVSSIDPQLGPLVYLITASIKDTEQMFSAIYSRYKQLQDRKRSTEHHDDDPPVKLSKLQEDGSSEEVPVLENSNETSSSEA